MRNCEQEFDSVAQNAGIDIRRLWMKLAFLLIIVAITACADSSSSTSIPLSAISSQTPYLIKLNNLSLAITVSADQKEAIAVILSDTSVSKGEVKWSNEDKRFINPVNGSAFGIDGSYLLGPSPRSLDQVKATIQNGNVVIDTSKVSLGEIHN